MNPFLTAYRQQIGTAQPRHVQNITHAAVGQHLERVVQKRMFAPPRNARCRHAAARQTRDVDADALAVRSDGTVGVRGAHVIQDDQLCGRHCAYKTPYVWSLLDNCHWTTDKKTKTFDDAYPTRTDWCASFASAISGSQLYTCTGRHRCAWSPWCAATADGCRSGSALWWWIPTRPPSERPAGAVSPGHRSCAHVGRSIN